MRKKAGFSIIELGTVIVVMTGVSLVSAFMARSGRLSHIRHRAKATACLNNCKSLADGFAQYTNDSVNDGRWMWINGAKWDSPTGTNRQTDYKPGFEAPDDRAITALLFMLVRRGEAKMEHFICPADKNAKKQEFVDLESEYDFADKKHVSYSYTAPLKAPGGGTMSGADPRCRYPAKVAVLTDKNDGTPKGPWKSDTADEDRRKMISQNHNGHIFNMVWQSGDVKIAARADIGVDMDNINAAGDPPSRAQTKISIVRTNRNDSCVIGPY